MRVWNFTRGALSQASDRLRPQSSGNPSDKTRTRRFAVTAFLTLIATVFVACTAHAQNGTIPIPTIPGTAPAKNPGQVANTLQILILMTVLTVAPSIMIMMTAFTRIVIVLSFLRSALGTQGIPPNQGLFVLALFLTF